MTHSGFLPASKPVLWDMRSCEEWRTPAAIPVRIGDWGLEGLPRTDAVSCLNRFAGIMAGRMTRWYH